MAFNADYLQLLAPSGGKSKHIVRYKTEDTLATVAGAGYFTTAHQRIEVGDTIIVDVVTNIDASNEALVTTAEFLVLASSSTAVTILQIWERPLAGGLIADHMQPDAVLKTTSYTVVSNTDAGKHFYIDGSADTTFTLPAIAIGNTFTFINWGDDGEALLTISPNASDGISFKGSATDDKDLINTKATAKHGDFVTLAALDQVVAWQVTAVRGVWAKEA